MNATPVRLCEIDGCTRKHHARGMCVTRIARVRRSGTTDAPPRASMADRFWSKVTKTETCWLFQSVGSNGYGAFNGFKTTTAHRFAYEICIGPIPDGLEIDHLCRVRACVNPAHLEAVTHWENTMRAPDHLAPTNAQKNWCLRGHPFSDENTYVSKDGRRHCIACRAIRESLRRIKCQSSI